MIFIMILRLLLLLKGFFIFIFTYFLTFNPLIKVLRFSLCIVFLCSEKSSKIQKSHLLMVHLILIFLR